LAAACLGFFLVLLGGSALNLALPALATALHGSSATPQWVVDAYTVPLAGAVLGAGGVSDRWGARRVFGWSLAGFTGASAVCAVSPVLPVLALARLAQGLAAAGVLAGSLALIAELRPEPRERARAVAAWSAAGALALLAGPVGGAALTQSFGWRAVFLVNLPVGALALALCGGGGRVRAPEGAGADVRTVVSKPGVAELPKGTAMAGPALLGPGTLGPGMLGTGVSGAMFGVRGPGAGAGAPADPGRGRQAWPVAAPSCLDASRPRRGAVVAEPGALGSGPAAAASAAANGAPVGRGPARGAAGPSLGGPRPVRTASADARRAGGTPVDALPGGAPSGEALSGEALSGAVGTSASGAARAGTGRVSLLPGGGAPAAPARHGDVVGQCAVALALSALVLGLAEFGPLGAGSPVPWALLTAGALAAAVFALRERRSASPLLPAPQLRRPAFAACLANGFAFQFGGYGLQFMLALALQRASPGQAPPLGARAGHGPLAAGLALAPFGTAWVVATLVVHLRMSAAARSGRSRTPRPRRGLCAGAVAACAGTLVLLLAEVPAGAPAARPLFLAGTVVTGAGCGVIAPHLNASVLGAVGPELVGLGSGALNAARQTGMAVAAALLGSLVGLPAARLRLGLGLGLALIACGFLSVAVATVLTGTRPPLSGLHRRPRLHRTPGRSRRTSASIASRTTPSPVSTGRTARPARTVLSPRSRTSSRRSSAV